MPEPITFSEPITIDHVDSVKELSKKMLKHCYFYPMGEETYSLFSSADELLAEDLRSGQDFEFVLGPYKFGVRDFKIDSQSGHGHWTADLSRVIARPGDRDAEDEGSFQAAAGGVPEENAAAASS